MISKHILLILILSIIVSGTAVAQEISEAESGNLLDQTWFLQGVGPLEAYQSLNSDDLIGMDTLRIRFNLHGLCALQGDASAIIIDQNGWNIISIYDYANNCLDGEQTIDVPLSDFHNVSGGADLDVSQSVGSLHTRFWDESEYMVEIFSIVALGPEPSPTPLPTISLTLFLDPDSLTLLIPFSPESVNLTDVALQVTQSNGQPIIRRLDRDFTAFLGLPYGNMDVLGAVCLRLVRSGSTGPVPLECPNGQQLFTQQVANADVFWFDSSSNVPRVVTMLQNGAFVGLCPAGQDACEIVMTLQPATPTPTPSSTPTAAGETPSPTLTPISVPMQAATSPTSGYPCEGTITFTTGALINQVRVSPQDNAPLRSPVQQGSKVRILGMRINLNKKWYQIEYSAENEVGWIPENYVEQSPLCPLD